MEAKSYKKTCLLRRGQVFEFVWQSVFDYSSFLAGAAFGAGAAALAAGFVVVADA